MTEVVVQKCYISKRFIKSYCNSPVLEPLSYKVVGCMPATSSRDSNTGVFLQIMQSFSEHVFLRENLWISTFAMNILFQLLCWSNQLGFSVFKLEYHTSDHNIVFQFQCWSLFLKSCKPLGLKTRLRHRCFPVLSNVDKSLSFEG